MHRRLFHNHEDEFESLGELFHIHPDIGEVAQCEQPTDVLADDRILVRAPWLGLDLGQNGIVRDGLRPADLDQHDPITLLGHDSGRTHQDHPDEPQGPCRVRGAGCGVTLRIPHPTHTWASDSKRVYSLRNVSFTVPVGPLRCLAMMISAIPRFSSVRL